jgi:hypothetical protein
VISDIFGGYGTKLKMQSEIKPPLKVPRPHSDQSRKPAEFLKGQKHVKSWTKQ